MATKTTKTTTTSKATTPVSEAGQAVEVTVRGLTLTVDADAFDDFELLEEIAAVADGDALRVVPLAKRVFGGDYTRVLDHLRTKGGRVPATDVVTFLTDLMGKVSPNS